MVASDSALNSTFGKTVFTDNSDLPGATYDAGGAAGVYAIGGRGTVPAALSRGVSATLAVAALAPFMACCPLADEAAQAAARIKDAATKSTFTAYPPAIHPLALELAQSASRVPQFSKAPRCKASLR